MLIFTYSTTQTPAYVSLFSGPQVTAVTSMKLGHVVRGEELVKKGPWVSLLSMRQHTPLIT